MSTPDAPSVAACTGSAICSCSGTFRVASDVVPLSAGRTFSTLLRSAVAAIRGEVLQPYLAACDEPLLLVGDLALPQLLAAPAMHRRGRRDEPAVAHGAQEVG